MATTVASTNQGLSTGTSPGTTRPRFEGGDIVAERGQQEWWLFLLLHPQVAIVANDTLQVCWVGLWALLPNASLDVVVGLTTGFHPAAADCHGERGCLCLSMLAAEFHTSKQYISGRKWRITHDVAVILQLGSTMWKKSSVKWRRLSPKLKKFQQTAARYSCMAVSHGEWMKTTS